MGRHLCSRLLYVEQDATIYCVDNLITGRLSNIKRFRDNQSFFFVEADVTHDLTELVNAGNLPAEIHSVYHLACIASPPTYKKYSIETLHTNFVGTANVLELARKTGAKVLFTSTSEVYGDPLVHPQPEEYYGNVNTVGERSCYDEGKRVAETLMYEYRKKYGIDTKIVRIFNTYGPYMDIGDGRVITNFIQKVMKNEPLVIYGDGTQGRSFCYVSDMISGLVGMMRSDESGPINIGSPDNEFTLNELVETFEQILSRKLDVTYIDATENDPKQRRPVIDKAIDRLNWSPHVSLKNGLRETMEYFGIEFAPENSSIETTQV